ncbi:alpha/beta fold hydrolase [Mycolicibacterium vaccae]|uniref:alpha/beta fold hydrolase n=1 Tax=Mycolicibacterium vaccae TaxID=1810 RepID=UPI003CE900E1
MISGRSEQPRKTASLDGQFIDVAGGKLYAQVRNGDEPALVFLHYWGGSHRTWTPVIDRIDNRYAVVAYDQRGWGASRHVPGPFSIEQLVQDASRVIGRCVPGSYVVVGHSMGGKVAQLLAAGRPKGLAGAVLVAPAPPKPVDITIGQQQVLERAYDSSESINQSIDGPLTNIALSPPLREQVIEDSSKASDGARAAWPRLGIVQDIAPAVASIDVPVLVLAGSADHVEPPDVLNERLMPYVAHATIEVLPDVGHLSPLEAPDRVAHRIEHFVVDVLG